MRNLIISRTFNVIILVCGFIIAPLWYLQAVQTDLSNLSMLLAVLVTDPRLYIYMATLQTVYVASSDPKNVSATQCGALVALLSLAANLLLYFMSNFGVATQHTLLLNTLIMPLFCGFYSYCLARVMAYARSSVQLLHLATLIFLVLPLVQVVLFSFLVTGSLIQITPWEIGIFWINLLFLLQQVILYVVFTGFASMWHKHHGQGNITRVGDIVHASDFTN